MSLFIIVCIGVIIWSYFKITNNQEQEKRGNVNFYMEFFDRTIEWLESANRAALNLQKDVSNERSFLEYKKILLDQNIRNFYKPYNVPDDVNVFTDPFFDDVKQATNFYELFGNEVNLDKHIKNYQDALENFRRQAQESRDYAGSRGY